MIYNKATNQQTKISPEFASRLGRLLHGEKVRAIVVLLNQSSGKRTMRHRSRSARLATIEMIHKSSEQALGDINGMLKRFGGKLLADKVNALGCIPVETTGAGIYALAASDHVKAVLEDQPIVAFHAPKKS